MIWLTNYNLFEVLCIIYEFSLKEKRQWRTVPSCKALWVNCFRYVAVRAGPLTIASWRRHNETHLELIGECEMGRQHSGGLKVGDEHFQDFVVPWHKFECCLFYDILSQSVEVSASFNNLQCSLIKISRIAELIAGDLTKLCNILVLFSTLCIMHI